MGQDTAVGPLCVKIYEIATDHSELFTWKHLQPVSKLAHSYLKILRYVNWVNHPNKPTTRGPHQNWVELTKLRFVNSIHQNLNKA